MIRPSNEVSVYLCKRHVDMRKSIDGLTALVEQQLCMNPFGEQVFVFCNRKRDKVKLLLWERNGFILWYKRLEKERFKWPKPINTEVIELTGQQLNWLLDGFDLWRNQPHQRLAFESVV